MKWLVRSALAFALTATTQAAVIGFEGLTPSGNLSGGVPTVPAITDLFMGQGVIFGRPGFSAGVVPGTGFGLMPASGTNLAVGLDAGGNIPTTSTGDIYFRFVEPGTTTDTATSGISFWIGDGGGDLDIFEIRAYDLADTLIETQMHSETVLFQVMLAASNIHRVEIDFTGSFGYGLDDLEFQSMSVQPIPEPSSALLLVTGGIFLALVRRRLKVKN